MRPVQKHLVSRISVDRCHEPGPDFAVLIKNFCHRGKAVGRAGSRRNYIVFRGESFVVGSVDDGRKIVSCRRRNQHFFSPGVYMRLRLCFRREKSRTLKNYIDFEFFPRELFRVFSRQNPDFLSVDRNGAVVAFHRMSPVSSLHAVVFQQVSQHAGLGQIIYGHDFHRIVSKNLSESKSSYSAKSVDCNSYHNLSSSSQLNIFYHNYNLSTPLFCPSYRLESLPDKLTQRWRTHQSRTCQKFCRPLLKVSPDVSKVLPTELKILTAFA